MLSCSYPLHFPAPVYLQLISLECRWTEFYIYILYRKTLQFLIPDRCLTQRCRYLPASSFSQCSLLWYLLFHSKPHLWLIAILWRNVFLFHYHFSFIVYCVILQGFLRKIVSNFPETDTAPPCILFTSLLIHLAILRWSSCFLILLIVSHMTLPQIYIYFFLFFTQGKSHGYNLFIKGRYQAAQHALPLINLCWFSVCFLFSSMSLTVPRFHTVGAVKLLLFSCLYPFPYFFSQ